MNLCSCIWGGGLIVLGIAFIFIYRWLVRGPIVVHEEQREKPEKQASGIAFIAFGLGLCAITLIGMMIIGSTGVAPQSGRGQLITTFGLPAGIIVTIVGIVMLVRRRNQ